MTTSSKPAKAAKAPKQAKPKKPKANKVANVAMALPLDAIAFHPATRDIPYSHEESEELNALTRDVAERGIDQPVMVVANGKNAWWLVDGRQRFSAAMGAGLKTIPAILRNEEDVPGIILASLVLRKHFTRGALAYISVPFLAPAAEASKARKRANTLVGTQRQETESDENAVTLEQECVKLGFSIDLYQQAKRVHEIFEENADYKAKIEPQILSGETSLGGALAGYGGRASTKDKAKPAANYLVLDKQGNAQGLMPKAIITLANGFKSWAKLDLAARAALKKEWDELTALVPEDLR